MDVNLNIESNDFFFSSDCNNSLLGKNEINNIRELAYERMIISKGYERIKNPEKIKLKKNLIGNRNGQLKAINLLKKKKNYYYECLCSCGNKKIISSYYFSHKKYENCGKGICAHKKNIKDNLIGKTFFNLTVLKYIYSVKEKRNFWLCRCSCGGSKVVSTTDLKNGHVKSCGCLRKRKAQSPLNDLSGKEFGFLKVLKPIRKVNEPGFKYICRCSCGKEKEVSAFNLTMGKTKSCGCLKKKSPKNKIADRILAIQKNIYRDAIINRSKKLGFDKYISFEEFKTLISKKCRYCGTSHSNKSKDRQKNECQNDSSEIVFEYNGLDRVDNQKGYISENVVPCCKFCNSAKSQMPIEDFKKWIEKVYKYQHKEN